MLGFWDNPLDEPDILVECLDMKYAHTSRRVVEFAETDMAGLVHFTNYFRYAERAEADFFDDLGESLIQRSGGDNSGWPRVRAECRYAAPLYFRDEIEITIAVKALKERAIDWQFAIFKMHAGAPSVRVAKGSFSTVHVKVDPASGDLVSLSIPDVLLSKICEAPEGYIGSLQSHNPG